MKFQNRQNKLTRGNRNKSSDCFWKAGWGDCGSVDWEGDHGNFLGGEKCSVLIFIGLTEWYIKIGVFHFM